VGGVRPAHGDAAVDSGPSVRWSSFKVLHACPCNDCPNTLHLRPRFGRELYDHAAAVPADFVMEGENLAGRPERKALVTRLSTALRAGWRASVPRLHHEREL